MKIEPFLINSSVNTIIAQRLCRKICDSCKEEVTMDQANITEVENDMKTLPKTEKQPEKIQFFKGKGCSNCGSTGYKGRVGIYEVLNVTNDIKDLIAKRASSTDINEQAINNGMTTMRQDGILKVMDGITTIDEIWRVTKD